MPQLRSSSVTAFAITAAVVLLIPAVARGQQPGCSPLPPPAGNVIDVAPSQAGSLQSILDAARPGDTVQLLDGVYSLPETLALRRPGVTMRSRSGNREAVVLDGRYTARNLLLVQRSDVTIADLTLMRSYWHLVHVAPEGGSSSGTVLHNLRAIDGGEQFIKINPVGDQYADNGVIRCSSLEMTDEGRAQVRNNCYTGGIDLHQGRGWHIYANVFSGFWCTRGLSQHAIHAWTGSRDTLVDRNVIINSARGIGFGLGGATAGRTYDDETCRGPASFGHCGGAITNNFVVATDPGLFSSEAGFDVGIGLEQSWLTSVLHNTVVSTAAPRSSSIEWRFTNSIATIANNLVSHNLEQRDGGHAILGGNLESAPLSLFVDVASGNLHLSDDAGAAIDKAVPLSQGPPMDIDAEPRGAIADIGADELVRVPENQRLAFSRRRFPN
jgi:hypothetical protein